MDDSNLLEIAQKAIIRLSKIASDLGVERRLQICSNLGIELLVVGESLNAPEIEYEKDLNQRLSKLLRDMERVCSVAAPIASPQANQYQRLKILGVETIHSAKYKLVIKDIQRDLEANTRTKPCFVQTAVKHVKRFSGHLGAKRPVIADPEAVPKTTPIEYATKVKMLVYTVLNKHMECKCCDDEGNPRSHKHIARLLLKAEQSFTLDDHAEYEMLFSTAEDKGESSSSWVKRRAFCWQDVQVLVPREKKVGFTDQEQQSPVPSALQKVDPGRFCQLINLNENSRLCLTIRKNTLLKGRPDQLKQIVDNEPGISLSRLLDTYRLSVDMKGALAYILAQSVWQFYESDWMNTRWDSDTIQFIPGTKSDDNGTYPQSRIFAWKPYFSIRFGEKDLDFGDCSPTGSDEIHRYPRIGALGIMLVEIAIGRSLQSHLEEGSLVAKRNKVWGLATEYSDSKSHWKDFPIPSYRTAVKHCLDPKNFEILPNTRARTRVEKSQLDVGKRKTISVGQFEDEQSETLRRRRKMLYEKVVSPLENLVRACGWIEDLSTMGPVEIPPASPLPTNTSDPNPTIARKSSTTRQLTQSSTWLSHITQFNNEVMNEIRRPSTHRPARIKIAVLDTGLDENVPFFQIRARSSRLREWKDWAKESPDPQDLEGHGTHIVSLIMTLAPDADIYVARIAEDRKGLGGESDEIIAKAIGWATTEWKADIISLSFGYQKAKTKIKTAIQGSLLARGDEILYFAAAANFGMREPEMFPARLPSVISIRGHNANGMFPDFNPPLRDDEAIVYGTLGVDVPGASISGKQKHRTGCSVATAVGAGIAGVLLEYSSWKSQENRNTEVLRKLKTQEGMLAMFKALAIPSFHNKGHLCVSLQKLLSITETQRWAKFEDALADVD